ncbi:MAG: hypothetical protein NTW19_10405 [Planctomycetota bacterium]|nr:hypothetical protein [Planctomycetota bacterium]
MSWPTEAAAYLKLDLRLRTPEQALLRLARAGKIGRILVCGTVSLR